MRAWITSALEVAGAVMISVGCWMVAAPLGMIAAGVAAIAFGYLGDET